MRTSDFDYELPLEFIAQTPVEPRDASRLMVVHRATGWIEHRIFHEIGQYLQPGDLLVLNQTRVIPARLFGRKIPTGGRVELLLLSRRDKYTWEALVRGKGLRPGVAMQLQATRDISRTAPALRAEIVTETGLSGRMIHFEQPIEPFLDLLGTVPLPPYIHQPLADPERYQTVYGRVKGSVAASTAGLHFTTELLSRLQNMGVELTFLTLHIGLDTFQPVKEEQIEQHQMHTEWYELSELTADQVNRARLGGRRVIAVGTTVVRALESAAKAGAPDDQGFEEQTVSAYAGPTDLFIYPGYRFRVVDAMITNFHLPRSTLLMLVSAFAGRDLIFRAYREAIRLGYRFFSFGDAMLLV